MSNQYDEALAQASLEDFSDLDDLGFLHIGKDKEGKRVILVVAKNFPAAVFPLDRLYRYIVVRCDTVVSEAYSMVWLHTKSTYFNNCPSLYWMWRTWERFPLKYRESLTTLRIVHCDLSLWAALSLVGPWISSRLWAKVAWVSRSEFLTEVLPQRVLSKLPEWVVEHDEHLEQHPLADYGVYVDKTLLAQNGGAPI